MRISVFLAAMLAVCSVNCAEVNVYAAASLTDVMKEIATAYEKESGDKILFNFGASSLLARQIIERAPADIFMSADEASFPGQRYRSSNQDPAIISASSAIHARC